MFNDHRLARMLETLVQRGRSLQRGASDRSARRRLRRSDDPLADLAGACRRLLAAREAAGMPAALAIIDGYAALSASERASFFLLLADDFAPDWTAVRAAFAAHEAAPARASFKHLVRTLEPPRLELFRRINRAPGGTAALLQMRADVLAILREHPAAGVVDDDLEHLLRSWFNRGFLVMERIGWSTPADLLERIIRYEAVHRIDDWEELRRRLSPPDRRCYAFFHPALANDPLIFVEVALMRTIPDSIKTVLEPGREVVVPESATTAVFYSISNCQPGLQGIPFGTVLIKQVVEELLRELPGLTTFVTLSPLPGFRQWLEPRLAGEADVAAMVRAGELPSASAERAAIAERMLPLAAEYLLDHKDGAGRPCDPVARFHLGNGARIERLCWPADVSPNGLATSAGVMVNYRYDLDKLEANHAAYADEHRIVASEAVRKLRDKRGAAREKQHVG